MWVWFWGKYNRFFKINLLPYYRYLSVFKHLSFKILWLKLIENLPQNCCLGELKYRRPRFQQKKNIAMIIIQNRLHSILVFHPTIQDKIISTPSTSSYSRTKYHSWNSHCPPEPMCVYTNFRVTNSHHILLFDSFLIQIFLFPSYPKTSAPPKKFFSSSPV